MDTTARADDPAQRSAADVAARVVRPEIRALTAYPVAKAAGMIKLDAMESPFGLSEPLRAKLAAALAAVPVNRYPDGGADAVKAALRDAFAIPAELGVLVGNGFDEAYHAFADATFMTRIAQFANLLVLRTVSKIGMAGIRLGYAIADPAWIAELDKVRQPYNLNALTQAAAPVLLRERETIATWAATLKSERARLEAAIAQCPGVPGS